MARPDGTGDRPPGRLRILLVSHSLGGGGAERFVATLASRLDRERFRPAVCVATGGGGYSVPADVPVTELGYRGLHDLPGAVVRLARHLRRDPPDLVVSNVLSTNCLTGAALGLVPERPPWVARGGNAPEHGDPLLQRLWARRVYPRADRIVTNSRGLREGFLRYYPGLYRGLGERCLALPNPTDFQEIDRRAAEGLPGELRARLDDDLAPGTARLLWVGRLGRQKRPDLALECLARLRALPGGPDGPVDARLWICGEGPWRGRLERRAAALGLGGAVRFLGFQENPFALMRAADLLLLTSDFEGLPNALIEAQGLGLPAVATRCEFGPDEVVADGETGVLVSPGDARALAAAAAAVLGDPERRRAMGEAASRRARELFGLERVLPRWEAFLEEAARGAR